MKRLALLAGTTLCLTMVVATGCGQKQENVSYKKISRNLTPELSTLSERKIDVDRHVQETNNQNMRMFVEDWGRSFYTDAPSRLSPFPITNPTGVPR